MTLTLFVTNNCDSCERVKLQIQNLIKKKKSVILNVENINYTNNKNILIVPALYIDNELYSYGELDNTKFLMRIEDYQ